MLLDFSSQGISFIKNRPIPASLNRLNFNIKRDKSGITKRIFTHYLLSLASNNKFIMMGKKMQIMRSANYLISMERDCSDKRTAGYLGCLKSNLLGGDYDAYDEETINPSAPSETIKNQSASIIYHTTHFGSKEPNKV